MSIEGLREFMAGLRGKIYTLKFSFLKKNIVFGPGLKVYKKFHVGGMGKIVVGQNCTIDGIKGDSKQYVTIDAYDPNSLIIIGDNACLYAARISARFSVTIGDDVLIEEAGITDSNFHSIEKSRSRPHETVTECQVTIGDRVSVGARSLITKGVAIGDDAVIWPGSVVTRALPRGCIAYGNPAKPLRK